MKQQEFYVYMAVVHHENYVKFSDCIDVLPPDASHVKQVDRPLSIKSLKTIASILEMCGMDVCVDLGEYFYETPE